MLSQETIERYRRMTDAERLRLSFRLIAENTPYLLKGPPEVVKRRFELLRKQNDERNRALLTAFARTKKAK